MSSFDDVLTANAAYAETFANVDRSGMAARGLAVVTCMDSRISPLDLLGLEDGDAKILRNAGAQVTDDVLRTLVLAVHLLDVTRVMVVAHTDCRMVAVTDAEIHQAMTEGAGIDTRSLDFRTIADQRSTLAADVQRIRSYPFLPVGLPVTGCVYDVRTGRLEVAVPD